MIREYRYISLDARIKESKKKCVRQMHTIKYFTLWLYSNFIRFYKMKLSRFFHFHSICSSLLFYSNLNLIAKCDDVMSDDCIQHYFIISSFFFFQRIYCTSSSDYCNAYQCKEICTFITCKHGKPLFCLRNCNYKCFKT